MTQEEIKGIVEDFLIEEMEIDKAKIRDDARLQEDVGIDSLDFVDIVAFILKAFHFKVQAGDFKSLTTLGDLYKYIEERTK